MREQAIDIRGRGIETSGCSFPNFHKLKVHMNGTSSMFFETLDHEPARSQHGRSTFPARLFTSSTKGAEKFLANTSGDEPCQGARKGTQEKHLKTVNSEPAGTWWSVVHPFCMSGMSSRSKRASGPSCDLRTSFSPLSARNSCKGRRRNLGSSA